jgi:hypothetical protein
MASGSRGRFGDPRFVSFIQESNRKTLDTRFRDLVLKGRKALGFAFAAGAACAVAWVLVESAHALSMF